VDDELATAAAKGRTLGVISTLRAYIAVAGTRTGEGPPASPESLIEWISTNDKRFLEEQFVDESRGALVDDWGTPMVLYVKEDGHLWIGSAGPNKKWEGGTADDIVGGLLPTSGRRSRPSEKGADR